MGSYQNYKMTASDTKNATSTMSTTSAAFTIAKSPRIAKRSIDAFHTPPESTSQSPIPASKRRRTMETKINTPFFTPSPSPPARKWPLKLTIPHDEPSKAEQRTLKHRSRCAERWKPKLQRPYPSHREIKEAYQYKLMRHYTNHLVAAEPDYIKPRIDRSERVDNIRRDFPAVKPSPKPWISQQESSMWQINLGLNISATKSKMAQFSAWKNFSSREQDRIDRGREAMMESGLAVEDLEKELEGRPNRLPDWRKVRTGQFSQRLPIMEDRV